MSELKLDTSADNRMKRGGVTGIAIGALALLACELPIILAVIGFGGLGAVINAFRPPPVVELIGVMFLIAGIGILAVLLAKRMIKKKIE